MVCVRQPFASRTALEDHEAEIPMPPRKIRGVPFACQCGNSCMEPDCPLSSITRTNQELSVVCPEESVPPQQAFERGWICLKLEGHFLFRRWEYWRRLLILYGMRECQFLRFRRTTRITCCLKRRSVEQPWMHCGKRGMS